MAPILGALSLGSAGSYKLTGYGRGHNGAELLIHGSGEAEQENNAREKRVRLDTCDPPEHIQKCAPPTSQADAKSV